MHTATKRLQLTLRLVFFKFAVPMSYLSRDYVFNTLPSARVQKKTASLFSPPFLHPHLGTQQPNIVFVCLLERTNSVNPGCGYSCLALLGYLPIRQSWCFPVSSLIFLGLGNSKVSLHPSSLPCISVHPPCFFPFRFPYANSFNHTKKQKTKNKK